jgi:hypothetical protein
MNQNQTRRWTRRSTCWTQGGAPLLERPLKASNIKPGCWDTTPGRAHRIWIDNRAVVSVKDDRPQLLAGEVEVRHKRLTS